MTTATAVRERPILLADRLVRAVLEGRKTQTRRPIKRVGLDNCIELGRRRRKTHVLDAPKFPQLGPVVGDRLYVREAWAALMPGGDFVPFAGPPRDIPNWADVRYRATDPLASLDIESRGYPWRPSLHMPRWASRLVLEVTDVRVERIEDITGVDALAEGCDNGKSNPTMGIRWVLMQRMAFGRLWDEHYAGGPYSWAENPWVRAITFRRVEGDR